MAIIKVPKSHESAIRYACEVYAVPVRFYTDEKNEGLMKIEVNLTPEEAWLVSAEVQLRLRELALKERERIAGNDSLFDSFKIDFGQ